MTTATPPAESDSVSSAAVGQPRIRRHHLNAFIYLGSAVLSKAASLFLIPLYTSRMTREEYGVYGLCQTLYWLGPPLATFALANGLARFYFDETDPEKRARSQGRIATAIIILALAWALIAELVLWLAPGIHFGALDRPTLRYVVWICAAIAIADIPSLQYRNSERAARFAILNLSTFAIITGATTYLMLVRHMKLHGLLGGMLIGQGAAAVFGIVYTFVVLKPSLGREILAPALRYSIPFIPHMIGNTLMVGVDRWSLEHFKLTDDLGLYTLATQLVVPLQMATAAWNEASSPMFIATWRDGGYQAARKALPRVTLGFIASGGAVLAAIVLGMPILRFFVSARFQAAFPLVPWIGVGLLVGAMFSAFINVLFLNKKTRIIPVLTLTSVGVNLALNFALVPTYGVWGAVLATGAAYAFRSLLMYIFAMRAFRAAMST